MTIYSQLYKSVKAVSIGPLLILSKLTMKKKLSQNKPFSTNQSALFSCGRWNIRLDFIWKKCQKRENHEYDHRFLCKLRSGNMGARKSEQWPRIRRWWIRGKSLALYLKSIGDFIAKLAKYYTVVLIILLSGSIMRCETSMNDENDDKGSGKPVFFFVDLQFIVYSLCRKSWKPVEKCTSKANDHGASQRK